MKNKIIKGVLISVLFLSISIVQVAAAKPADIKNHWAAKDIEVGVNEGWAYLEKNSFKPDKPATREEVIWMLIGACKTIQSDWFNINKKADLSKFKDKPSPFAESRMAIAVGNNIIKGYPDKTLKPRSNITRAEFAVILGRLIKEDPPAMFSPFWDYIPEWALPEIKKVYKKGIVKGYPNGSFGAVKNVTKAEALVMIKRWRDMEKNRPTANKNIPQEFLEIQKNVSNVGFSEKYLFYNFFLQITYYPNEKVFVMEVNPYANNEEPLKKMLKVFYPTSYETVYQNILTTVRDKKDILNQVYDGRTFESKCIGIKAVVHIGTSGEVKK